MQEKVMQAKVEEVVNETIKKINYHSPAFDIYGNELNVLESEVRSLLYAIYSSREEFYDAVHRFYEECNEEYVRILLQRCCIEDAEIHDDQKQEALDEFDRDHLIAQRQRYMYIMISSVILENLESESELPWRKQNSILESLLSWILWKNVPREHTIEVSIPPGSGTSKMIASMLGMRTPNSTTMKVSFQVIADDAGFLRTIEQLESMGCTVRHASQSSMKTIAQWFNGKKT